MPAPNVNPYASPVTTEVAAKPRVAQGSMAIAVVSGLSTLAFVAFTIVLLRSTSGDRKAGMMFLSNVPVLIGLTLSAARSRRVAAYFAMFATVVQLAITCVLLQMFAADRLMVVFINSTIVVPCLMISAWAWFSSQHKSVANRATQDIERS